ncbi:helix-turn-helix transcriptional regulator [Enterococcus termitis]|nr:helix-turn-helix transcriptional regulator [Enterococcus termitis]OJG97214.1 DNA-binding protein [Enterococcus termitis]
MSIKSLKELRTENGLTQVELAELFNVSVGTIINMEKDSTNIKDSLLTKYLKAFEVEYDAIFLGKKYEKIVCNDKKNETIFKIKKRLKQSA